MVAALMVRNMSAKTPVVQVVEAEAEPVIPLTQVLVASADMPLGHRIAPEDLAWMAWPEEGVTDQFLTEETTTDAINELSGSVVRTPFFEGEPILEAKIVRLGDGSMLAGILTEGMRAVAVEISVETAAGGFILPNDRVDVLLSYEIETTEDELVVERPATRTVLENVRVLAIDQTYQKIEDENVVVGTTATLELSPRHVEILSLATQMGDISLTLRGLEEAAVSGTRAIAAADFQSAEDFSATVSVYSGGQVQKTAVGGNQ